MASRQKSKRVRPTQGGASETLEIRSGHLGPLGPCTFEIRPLTVFVGRQGTGKSLVAQVLYFFRGVPDLVRFDLARRRPGRQPEPAGAIIGRVVDGLRSSHRRFANLTRPNVALHWTGDLAVGGIFSGRRSLGFNAQHVTRQIQPHTALRDLVESVVRSRRRHPWTALFVPSERILYSLALGPTSLSLIGPPLVLEVFAMWMELAGQVQEGWAGGKPDTPSGRWVQDQLEAALGGTPRRRGSIWRWEFDDGERSIDLDMASSGQRANWPIMLIAPVLLSLKANGELAEGFTLYVEEPEIHLHPDAERVLVGAIAHLVRNGIRVVITTHSLTVLYTLNNLLAAGGLGDETLRSLVPVELRLQAGTVAAYHLLPDGSVASLIDDETGLIDESALGTVADDLASVMNRIWLARKSP